MDMRRSMITGCAFVLTMLLSSCQMTGTEQTAEENHKGSLSVDVGDISPDTVPDPVTDTMPGPASDTVPDPVSGVTVKAAQNLGTDHTLVTGGFFKAGDIQSGLRFEPTEEGSSSDRLRCIFTISDGQHASYYDRVRWADIVTRQDKRTYGITPETLEENPKLSALPYEITFAPDYGTGRRISVTGQDGPEGGLAGDYYLFEDSFTFPDVFRRYLSRADLCMWPTEDLGLLRNEIYAANGRKFKSDVLNRYFSQKEWYRGIVDTEEFADSMLTEVERRNIALIRELEGNPDRSRLDGLRRYGIEDLPFAPYLSCLGRYSETGLEADLRQAKDKGAYYVAQGEISVPASVSPRQLEEVMAGGQAEVIVNELTGESRILTLDPRAEEEKEPGYGFLLFQPGESHMDYGNETGIRADYNNGEYHLWQTSADTVMKTAYKGDIYILKGAVMGADTILERASESQREIIPPADGGGWEDIQYDSIFCNCLYSNARGYFTAVYMLGD